MALIENDPSSYDQEEESSEYRRLSPLKKILEYAILECAILEHAILECAILEYAILEYEVEPMP